MKYSNLAVFIVALLHAACRFNGSVEGGVTLRCQKDAHCPSNQKCYLNQSGGICVAKSSVSPGLVADISVTYRGKVPLPFAPTSLGEASEAVVQVVATSTGSLAKIDVTPCPGVSCAQAVADDPAYTFACVVSDAGAVVGTQCEVGFSLTGVTGMETPNAGTAVLDVDVVPPTPLDVDSAEAVLLRRAPWGSAGTQGVPEVSLRVRDVAAQERAVVYDGVLAGRVLAIGDEGATQVAVPVSDIATVGVNVVDRAGNSTGLREVRHIELVASLSEPPGAPTNPHRLATAGLDLAGASFLSGTVVNQTDGVALPDGRRAQTRGAGRWVERFTSARFEPHLAAFAFDESSGRGVAFGGCECWPLEGGKPGPRVFEWTGEDWVPQEPYDTEGDGSPVPSARAAMAFDARAGSVVLFGGSANAVGPVTDGFWEWKRTSWRRLTPPTMPSAREGHSMAWDATRRGVVLFGGRGADGGLLSDTWLWRDGDWSEITVAQRPEARFDHRMAWDSDSEELVVTGGRIGAGLTWDAWRLRDAGWEADSTLGSGLGKRAGHGFAFDRLRHQFVVIGGESPDGGAREDHWAFGDGGWVAEPPWSNFVLSWGSAPSITARAHGITFFDSARQVVVIGGGIPSKKFTLADLGEAVVRYLGNTATYVREDAGILRNAWSASGLFVRPSARTHMAMAYDPHREVVVMHGGETGSFLLDDTIEWNGKFFKTWTSSDGGVLPSPGARSLHAMAYDGIRQGMVLFGGNAEQGSTELVTPSSHEIRVDAGTWFGTPAAGWARLPISSPPARLGHAMVWNSGKQDITLVGGATFLATTPEQRLNGQRVRYTDSWTLGTTWVRGPNLPNTAVGAALSYDSFSGQEWVLPGVANEGFILQYVTALFSRANSPGSSTWVAIDPSNEPGYLTSQNLVYDADARRHWHYGAERFSTNGQGSSGQLWQWDGEGWAVVQVGDDGFGTPGSRSGARLAYDAKRGRTVLFGGLASDLWEFDLAPHRPRQVLEVNLDGAGVPATSELTSLVVSSTATAQAQARLPDAGWAAVEGAQLVPWVGGRWSDELSSSASDGGTQLMLSLNGRDVTRANAGTGRLRVKVVPRGVNGGSNAIVETDAIEATVRYRRQ